MATRTDKRLRNFLLFTTGFLFIGSVAYAVPPRQRLNDTSKEKVWKGDVSYNAYSGDYGTGEDTDTRILRLKLTRYFSAADLSVVLPYISVSGRTAVTSGGGKPR